MQGSHPHTLAWPLDRSSPEFLVDRKPTRHSPPSPGAGWGRQGSLWRTPSHASHRRELQEGSQVDTPMRTVGSLFLYLSAGCAPESTYYAERVHDTGPGR